MGPCFACYFASTIRMQSSPQSAAETAVARQPRGPTLCSTGCGQAGGRPRLRPLGVLCTCLHSGPLLGRARDYCARDPPTGNVRTPVLTHAATPCSSARSVICALEYRWHGTYVSICPVSPYLFLVTAPRCCLAWRLLLLRAGTIPGTFLGSVCFLVVSGFRVCRYNSCNSHDVAQLSCLSCTTSTFSTSNKHHCTS